jgi:hypothetical protein
MRNNIKEQSSFDKIEVKRVKYADYSPPTPSDRMSESKSHSY